MGGNNVNQQQQWQQQQQGQQQSQLTPMPEKDMLYTILADLKRTSQEYTIATMESNCPNVHQLFTDLLNSSLNLQNQLFTFMKQQNMYTTSSKVLQQEINKQIQQNQQCAQQSQQFIQQKMNQQNQQQQFQQQRPMYQN